MNQIIKATLRNIARDKFYFLVNVFGLVLGVTGALLLFSYVLNEFRYDKYHSQYENIYRISCSTLIDDKRTEFANMPPAIGPALLDAIPEIQTLARLSLPFPLNNGVSKIRVGDNEFLQTDVFMADSSLFSIFSYEFLAGNSSALEEPDAIVLTNELAEKLLGEGYLENKNLLGTIVEVDNKEFNITGVIKDVPSYSHLKPKALLSWVGLGSDEIWDDSQAYTYARLARKTNLETLKGKLQAFADEDENIQETAETFGAHVTIEAQPVADIHLYSNKQYELSTNLKWASIYIYILGGIFLILTSAVNFLNLTVALSVNRFKEIGLRKILGATANQIRNTLFREAVIVCVVAVLMAAVFFYLLLPSFNSLMGSQVEYEILLYPKFLFTILVTTLVIAAIAGIYPSLHLSMLNPIQVLKSKYSEDRGGIPLRKVLIIFQFVVTSLMLTATITIITQINYLNKKDLGFNKDHIMVIKMPDAQEGSLEVFRASMKNIAHVSQVASTDFLPGHSSMIDEHYIERQDGEMKSSTIARIFADENFVTLLSLKIIQGRGFVAGNAADYNTAFLVNEAAVRQFEWDKSPGGPIGKKIDGFNYGKKGEVIGVFNDANLFTLKESVKPLIISLSDVGYFIYLKIPEVSPEVMEDIKIQFESVFQGSTFDYVFLDESYRNLYDQDRQIKSALGSATIILIIISCLGLLGLSVLLMNQNLKQIGVRKVLGAQNFQIFTHFVKDFVRIILLANLVAFPIAYIYLNDFLSSYSYHIPLYWWLFVIPLLLTLFVAFATVGITIARASRVNPVIILKQD